MQKFMLNIKTGTIHNGDHLCSPGRRTAEANQKWFDTYAQARNFYKGDRKKGIPCVRCFGNGAFLENQ